MFCVDIQEHRLTQVESFGATPIDGRLERYALDRERILAKSPNGVDAVLETAGAASLVPEGVRLLRAGGSYVFVGMVHPQSRLDLYHLLAGQVKPALGMVHPQSRLDLTGEQVIRRCLTISGIHNYAPWHLDEAVHFLQQTKGKYPFEKLVSPPLALADLEDAFQLAETQRWHRVSVRPKS